MARAQALAAQAPDARHGDEIADDVVLLLPGGTVIEYRSAVIDSLR